MMLAALALLAATPVAEEPIAAPGPNGPLSGTLTGAGNGRPVVLIVPGSGPTDRDGNNPLGVKARSYTLLAEALAAKGVASVRIDKRGLFASRGAVADPNKVTIADYAVDVHAWVTAIRGRTGARCVWVLGHSEGGLVALAAAQAPEGMCGLVLVATAGRPLGQVMREQFRANPANAPLLADAEGAITALEAGRDVDVSRFHPALQRVFAPAVQGYLKDMLVRDPAKLIAATRLPVLILQGDTDLQVTAADARALAVAQPAATLALLPGVNHVLKVAPADRAGNMATYADPALPLAPGVASAVADFARAKR
ncbi:alpha/beta hydrolase [Sphingomonas aracearum]|uniref:Alpha/beta fold hydrolase n=1 Tax=Sphingomonas aracearum TaxID=2283317 RepID=A0A369VXK9_9SPHN|nr:alpha/beta fold hydrolase [Sphingomonas aracearum]RDE07116.1 alpha/beta fold hydrolase [Sphingomonas aracearum]